jgi:phage shock protein E
MREKMIHRPSFRLTIGVIAVAFAACTAPADDPKQSADANSITAQALAEQIQSSQAPLILDVRSKAEFAKGHIPGALNIPVDQLPDRMSEIDAAKTDEIVLHCHSGNRAKRAEATLREAGYSNVLDLDGHMEGWKKGGYPIEKP